MWAIGAKNSATGTEMFGGKVDESEQTLQDPQWGTKYSLLNGDVVGKWCPSPPIIGSLIGALFPPAGVWVPEVRESNGYVEVKLDVDVSSRCRSSKMLLHCVSWQKQQCAPVLLQACVRKQQCAPVLLRVRSKMMTLTSSLCRPRLSLRRSSGRVFWTPRARPTVVTIKAGRRE